MLEFTEQTIVQSSCGAAAVFVDGTAYSGMLAVTPAKANGMGVVSRRRPKPPSVLTHGVSSTHETLTVSPDTGEIGSRNCK
jgi:hypothetical protein